MVHTYVPVCVSIIACINVCTMMHPDIQYTRVRTSIHVYIHVHIVHSSKWHSTMRTCPYRRAAHAHVHAHAHAHALPTFSSPHRHGNTCFQGRKKGPAANPVHRRRSPSSQRARWPGTWQSTGCLNGRVMHVHDSLQDALSVHAYPLLDVT